MLLSIKHLSNYDIEAKDGSIGHVKSFLFDDQNQHVRYLVVDTGNWLPGRKVLITPSFVKHPIGNMDVISVKLTREQVKNSPDVNTDKPVSREQELKIHKYYNLVPYWGMTFTPPPVALTKNPQEQAESQAKQETSENTGGSDQNNENHLRDTEELIGYTIHAKDGKIGSVDDFIVDDSWVIRYLIVDIGEWFSGKKVLVSPDWIESINWEDSEVVVDITKEAVENSPDFDPSTPVNKEYEVMLYDYYGRPRYRI